MKMKFKRKAKYLNKSGFTLIETLVSLFIISLILILIHIFILIFNQQPSNKSRTEEVYRWIDFIEDSHFDFEYTKQNQMTIFYSNTEHQSYRFKVNPNNNELYMYKYGSGGYMPLLSNVNWLYFDYHNHVLITHINLTNGESFVLHSLMREKK